MLELGKKLFVEVMPFATNNPIHGGVYNCLEMSGPFSKLNKWFNKVLYPHLIPLGYRCWGIATSDVFTQYAANLLINTLTPREVTARVFGDIDKANIWVYNQLEKTKR